MRRQPWDQQPWARFYEHAVLEIDGTKVTQQIQVAEAAISARLTELTKSNDTREQDALCDAWRVLQLIVKHGDWLKTT